MYIIRACFFCHVQVNPLLTEESNILRITRHVEKGFWKSKYTNAAIFFLAKLPNKLVQGLLVMRHFSGRKAVPKRSILVQLCSYFLLGIQEKVYRFGGVQ